MATGSPISVPTTIDYVEYATDSWLILPIENEVGKLTERLCHWPSFSRFI